MNYNYDLSLKVEICCKECRSFIDALAVPKGLILGFEITLSCQVGLS